MRAVLAIPVSVLGVIITFAGGAALYQHALIADETGISGWNPTLWIVILGGLATVGVGVLQPAVTAGSRGTGLLAHDRVIR